MSSARLNRTIDLVEQNFVVEFSLVDRRAFLDAFIKFLKSLLHIRKMAHYGYNSVALINRFEIMLKEKKYSDLELNFSVLKNIAGELSELSDAEAESFEKYLDSVLSNVSDSLANYLSGKLGIPHSLRYDPDNFEDSSMKLFAVLQSMRSEGYLEDFQMSIPDSIGDKAINDLIVKYYFDRGYKMFSKLETGFMFCREKEFTIICVTRTDILQVTVVK